MSSRAPFTDNEDNLLVKYIATYNPQTTGRSGNKLYRTLCEDPDKKWKWSRTHPWQSWRDRYCKNQSEFNLKIKKYQIKHDLLHSRENMDQESSEEKQLQQSKRKRDDEKEEKRAKVKLEPKHNQIQSLATEAILDKGKRKAVTNDTEGDQIHEDQITQEQGVGLDVIPADGVNQKGGDAHEIRRPESTLISSPPLHTNAKGPPSPTLKSNSPATEINGRQKKPSINHETSHHTVLADSRPVASTSKVQLSSPETNAPTEAKGIPSSRRRKPVVKDDVFFESAPPTPSPPGPSNATRPKHRKPKLEEGAFGTRFASRRKISKSENDSSEDEKETLDWPPQRKKNNSKGKGKAVEAITTNTVTSTFPPVAETVPEVMSPTNRRETHSVDKHQPRKTSLNSMNGLDNGQVEVDTSSTSLQMHQGHIQHPVQSEKPHEVKETSDQPRLSRVSSGLSHVFNLEPTSKTKPSAAESINPLLPRNSWTPNNPAEAIIRRHSMGNLREFQGSAVRRLDLRAEIAKRRLAASSPFNHSRENSVVSTVSYQPSPKLSHGRPNQSMNTDNIQRRRSSIPIADEDREHIQFLGLNTAIEGIAQESGFVVEQVWRIYNSYGSIKRTEEWVRLYQKNSAMLQEITHEQMMKNGMGMLVDITDEQWAPRSSPLERGQKREPSTESTMSIRPSPPKTQENYLKIKPLDPDTQHSPFEYSPPQETRAGEYNRLVGQGRLEEAMLREHRRASGSGGVFPRLRSSQVIWGTPRGSSPINDDETVERDRDWTEDEGDVEQLIDESDSEAAEDIRGLQEDEEMLFLTAHVGVVDKMRAIEQNMNPDYMLRWVAAQFGEMENKFRSFPTTLPSSPS